MNAATLLLKKKTFISWLVLFCHREDNEMRENASYLLLLHQAQGHIFRCLINHTGEYSLTTKSKPIKAAPDLNIFVAIIAPAERKPGKGAHEKILALITEAFLQDFRLDATSPGSR